MSNINDSLFEAYLFETNSLLEKLDELLLEAESSGDLSEDAVNEIFRSMHTIKGSSAMMEFKPLMEIAHHVEDLFFAIRENGMGDFSQEKKGELFNLLFKCNDRLKEDVLKVENGEELSDNIADFIEEIDSFLKSTKDEPAKPAPAPVENKAPESGNAEVTRVVEVDPEALVGFTSEIDAPEHPYYLHIFFDDDCGMENLRAFIIVTALKEAEMEFLFSPPDIETNSETSEKIVNDGFYVFFKTDDEIEKAIQAIASMANIKSYEVLMNPKYIDPEAEKEAAAAAAAEKEAEAEVEVEEKPIQKAEPKAEVSKQIKALSNTKQSLISVSLSKLDKLMALVGEIVITESMVASSPELKGVKLDNFLKSTRQLRKLTDDLQDIAMSLRMVSVSAVFQKMNRIVRDMTKSLNKDVALTIIGEDTEVDKTIVDCIADPIMHIVRNAMDHGIEKTAQERIDKGKNPQGAIVLSAEHTGSEVIIKISNDGSEMDAERILAKANKKGLLSKPPEEYTRKEALSLLMLPGFSTNSQVTEYSGRGVGLDVVKKNVESIGGTVTITNDPGDVCCFTLKIPLTLAIVDGMEISVGGEAFTIPIANIRQSFKADDSDILFDASGNEIISWQGEFFPVVRLYDALQIPAESTKIADGILILVEANEKPYCLFVDKLHGEQQVVVKPLPSYLNAYNIKNSGISGCTILGNGNISIILDIGNLYTSTQRP